MTVVISENQQKVVNVGSLGDLMMVAKKRENCKMKWLIGLQICTIIFILLTIVTFYLVAYPIINENQGLKNVTHNNAKPDNTRQNENIVTLYGLDPVARAFCFGDGKYGQIIENGSVYNRRSDIDFNNYYIGNFTVGIEGGEVGTIIDLGSSADLQKKYKYQETVGNGQGFASIRIKNKTILILKNLPYNNTFQPMEESKELFRDDRSLSRASVKLGHVYVLRITGYTDTTRERIVKMLVIAYQTNEWVTIRWEVLV